MDDIGSPRAGCFMRELIATDIRATFEICEATEIHANLRVHLHITRSHDLDVLHAVSQVASGHRLILEAIQAGDSRAVEDAAYRHLADPRRDGGQPPA
jgi:DNA-binding GntR family transcriptional regulator